jgi:hypothetical protein
VQTVPQAPQFCASVRSATSHPVLTALSQLPKPALQTIEQAPAEQLANPFTELHAMPQVPQWAVDVLMLVSQPLEAALSQLPQPVSQAATAQVPVLHAPVAWAGAHATEHAPQSVSVRMLVSQPLAGLPSQLA